MEFTFKLGIWAYHEPSGLLYQIENEEDAVGLLRLPKHKDGLIMFWAYVSFEAVDIDSPSFKTYLSQGEPHDHD